MSFLMFPSSSLQKKQPNIAIIIPVYNIATYLHECLDSILNQSYTKFTVFAINDGSTDESGAILNSYAAIDKRIIVLNQKNSGQGVARNLALDLIDKDGTFDYVSFIDGDDKVAPNFLSLLIQVATQNQSDITVCGFFIFDDMGTTTIEGKPNPKGYLNKEEFVKLIFAQCRWKHAYGAGGMVWKKLFSASTVKGVRFPTDRDMVEDELFCLCTALLANNISYVPEVLYGYRKRANSSVRNERFMLQLCKGRYQCIDVARKISNYSELVAVSSFAQSAVRLLKSTNSIPELNLKEFKTLLKKALKEDLIDKKTLRHFILFCDYPRMARIYFAQKKLLNSIKFWKHPQQN